MGGIFATVKLMTMERRIALGYFALRSAPAHQGASADAEAHLFRKGLTPSCFPSCSP
jgi:hypothetical protein